MVVLSDVISWRCEQEPRSGHASISPHHNSIFWVEAWAFNIHSGNVMKERSGTSETFIHRILCVLRKFKKVNQNMDISNLQNVGIHEMIINPKSILKSNSLRTTPKSNIFVEIEEMWESSLCYWSCFVLFLVGAYVAWGQASGKYYRSCVESAFITHKHANFLLFDQGYGSRCQSKQSGRRRMQPGLLDFEKDNKGK